MIGASAEPSEALWRSGERDGQRSRAAHDFAVGGVEGGRQGARGRVIEGDWQVDAADALWTRFEISAPFITLRLDRRRE